MRLIDADALIDNTDDRYSLGEIGRREHDDIVYALEYAPTIPGRKKGMWERAPKSGRYRCNQCLLFALKTDDGQENLSDYCPVCGAEMRGKAE